MFSSNDLKLLFLAFTALTTSLTLANPFNSNHIQPRTDCRTVKETVNANVSKHSPKTHLTYCTRIAIICSRQVLRLTSCSQQFDEFNPVISPLPSLPLPTLFPTGMLSGNVPGSAVLNIVSIPYKQMDWHDAFQFHICKEYEQPPNRAIFDVVSTGLIAEKRITLLTPAPYAANQAFELRSGFFACQLNSQGAQYQYIDCTLHFTGTKTDGRVVEARLSYDGQNEGVVEFAFPVGDDGFSGPKEVKFDIETPKLIAFCAV